MSALYRPCMVIFPRIVAADAKSFLIDVLLAIGASLIEAVIGHVEEIAEIIREDSYRMCARET